VGSTEEVGVTEGIENLGGGFICRLAGGAG
jgi:hypothetical protein